jgi:hypothetical protein
MAFAQFTYRESLRDIEACLGSVGGKLYHMGFRARIAGSTLADANETHDWRIFADFAQHLIGIARPLHGAEKQGRLETFLGGVLLNKARTHFRHEKKVAGSLDAQNYGFPVVERASDAQRPNTHRRGDAADGRSPALHRSQSHKRHVPEGSPPLPGLFLRYLHMTCPKRGRRMKVENKKESEQNSRFRWRVRGAALELYRSAKSFR